MSVIADILLIAAALGATFYCVVLSQRLTRFTDLENGVGGAIAVLSQQVDDMTSSVLSAESAATTSAESLETLTGRAETAARRLELLVAALHDLPEDGPAPQSHEKPAESVPEPAEPVSKAPEPPKDPVDVPKADDQAAAVFSSRRGRVKEPAG